jgi:hypothetical protein
VVTLDVPRRAGLWAALTYAFATLSLGWPALVGRFLVSPHSDQYIAGYAFREFAAQSLRSGQGFPQWNPFLFGGMPYVAAMHGDIFYPTFLLRLVMPTDAAMSWGFIIHVFLCGLFTYAFLRAWGLGFFPSLIGGLAYLMCGPIAAYVSPGHDGKLFVSTLLPLSLWMLTLGIRRGRAWAWGVFALAIGLAVLSPHPQLLQYLLLTSGFFALYVAFAADETGVKLDRAVAIRRLGIALGAVIIGALMGAVQYLPVREYVDWSPRAGGKDWEHVVSYSMPIEELLNLYLPQFSGILDRYWGRNVIHLHSEYLGAAVLLLAGAALIPGRDAGAQRSFRWFWIGALIVATLWTLGGSTPFYRLVYAIVPGTKYFRAPSTFMYVMAFSVAVLAAVGTERVLTKRVGMRYAAGWIVAGILIAVLAASGAFYNLGMNIVGGLEQPGLAERSMGRLVEGRNDVMFGGLRSLVFVAAAAGIVITFLRGSLSAARSGWALAGTLALDLWTVERNYWQFSPPARELYAADPVIDHLKEHAATGRVLVLAQTDEGLANRDPYFGTDGRGTGTGLMIHGIRSVSGYHGNELGRYQSIVDARTEAGPIILSPAFWRHENVRYLYTNAPLADSQFKQLLGPVRNSAGSTVYLYELPGANPPAWVAASIVKAPDDAIAAAVIDPRFDPARFAAVSDTAPVEGIAPNAAPPLIAIGTRVTRPASDRIDIALDAPAPAGSALVVSENYFPGWSARVDDKDGSTVRANFNLIGVPLAAGARKVVLEFDSDAHDTGKLVTLLAFAAVLLSIAGGVLVDRRMTRG